jgi:hypothetical protein
MPQRAEGTHGLAPAPLEAAEPREGLDRPSSQGAWAYHGFAPAPPLSQGASTRSSVALKASGCSIWT